MGSAVVSCIALVLYNVMLVSTTEVKSYKRLAFHYVWFGGCVLMLGNVDRFFKGGNNVVGWSGVFTDGYFTALWTVIEAVYL
jgi:hypothetical protein